MKQKEKQKFMQEAIKEARKASAFGEVPVGAVIIHDGRIIARAHNQVERLKDATAHAEILAITQASSFLSDWRLKACSLFVTVEPCTMCTGAIKLSRISHIYFGAYDPKKEAERNFSFKVEGGILKEECAVLLKKFFPRLRKK
jgi:tRNA(adenine34) deaminase